MKKLAVLFLGLVLSLSSFAQGGSPTKIKIEIKPVDPKKGYSFEIYKTKDEVKIYQHKVDSIAKFTFSEEDAATMKRLMGQLDSLNKDSLAFYQRKIDSIKGANTFYKTDSATIYKSTHAAYWKFLETILATPKDVLEKKSSQTTANNDTYGFFTFNENNQQTEVFIESLEPKIYPLLTKLVVDTGEIMKAHKMVMERKNQ